MLVGGQSSGILRCTVLKTVLYGLVWEISSIILLWIELKAVLYRLVGEVVFMYTAVDCTEYCFILFGEGSILLLYCGGLY